MACAAPLPVGCGLVQVVRVGGLAEAGDGDERPRVAGLGVGGAFEDEDAVPFAELHAAPAAREGSERAMCDEAQGVEAGVDVLADGVVAAGEDDVGGTAGEERQGRGRRCRGCWSRHCRW